jgi:hypothetical protein
VGVQASKMDSVWTAAAFTASTVVLGSWLFPAWYSQWKLRAAARHHRDAAASRRQQVRLWPSFYVPFTFFPHQPPEPLRHSPSPLPPYLSLSLSLTHTHTFSLTFPCTS